MVREYQVVGRKIEQDATKPSQVYRMRIFANNKTIAKSRFWYFLSKLRKVKSTSGEILSCSEIVEKRPNVVKNFGIFLRYNSRHGIHNIYKEFRDISRCGAVKQLYADMASHHAATGSNIHIIDVREIPASEVHRKTLVHFVNPHVRFPLMHQRPRMDKRHKRVFLPFRPTTF